MAGKPVPSIVAGTWEHLGAVAHGMRKADRDEVWAASHSSPYEALAHAMDTSTQVWTGMIDDRPICMFGVAPVSLLGGIGIPWMLGTDDIERHQLIFLRRCRPVVAEMLTLYNHLVNLVDERNTTSQRWLKWLGFTLHDPQPHGPDAMPFRLFELRRQDDV